jgi:hypothetical protein
MPRINFVSLTFLVAFGLGAFTGIALALLAVALVKPESTTTIIEDQPAAVAPTTTPLPTATELPPTVTPTPIPVVRTLSTLQVRIGPDDGYAVLGTLSSGSKVELQGRDDAAKWVAIEFPPGSSARGWIPIDQVSGLTFVQAYALDVVAVNQIDNTPRYPGGSQGSTIVDGNDGFATETPDATAATGTAGAGTPTVRPTSTPRAVSSGPTDLAIGGYSLNASGVLTVTIANRGPGDVPAGLLSVQIIATGLQPEVLKSSSAVRAGDSVLLRTATIRITEPTDVTITVDGQGVLSDLDRSNNTLNLTLAP